MENEDIRPYDNTFKDRLISDMNQDWNQEEDDDIFNFILQESFEQYKKEEEIRSKNKKKELEKREKEMERVEGLRSELGLIVSRLKTIYKNDTKGQDLIRWIEWECTPYFMLKEFRPMTTHSLIELKEWIEKNLNPNMIKKIKDLSFF